MVCMGLKTVFVFLALILIVSGCTRQKSDSDIAKDLCIQECKKALKNGQNLKDGPCLSEKIIEDWVCDVAHNPRIEKDNMPQNQCKSFRSGEAHHFVEIDSECNLIRIY